MCRRLAPFVLGLSVLLARPAAGADVMNLLMVAANPAALTAQETVRKTTLESWGYTVTLIDDAATQAAFNTAAALNSAAYISEEINSPSLLAKLKNVTIGVLSEKADLAADMGFAQESITLRSRSDIRMDMTTLGYTAGSTVTIFTSAQPMSLLTGSIATGGFSVASGFNVGSNYDPVFIAVPTGGALYGGGIAAGRRILLPWGASGFNFNALNANGLTVMRQSLEWVARPNPAIGDLLLVVENSASLTAQETQRQYLLDIWGYNVSVLSASATQASYNTAIAANDVAYVSEEVSSTSVNTKLNLAALGVVTDEPALIDDLGLCTSFTASAGNSFNVSLNSHYVTSPYSIGLLPCFTASQPGIEAAGTLAKEALCLGTFSGTGKGLITIEAGGVLTGGSKAAGRRLALPWGGDATDIFALNNDGKKLLRRAVAWAAGTTGHWKLDESSGTNVADSGPNARNGTLTNTTFTTGSTTAKLSNGLQLDGVNDYVVIANHSVLQLRQSLTISGWIKGDAWGSNTDVDIILRKGDVAPVSYQLCIQDGRVALHLNESEGTGLGTLGNTVLQTGTWYHVAGTWDGSTAKVFVNGVLDCTPRSVSATLPLDTRSLYLGARAGADLTDGVIDDVRLYNYALTSEEVRNVKRTDQPRGVKVIKWVEVQ